MILDLFAGPGGWDEGARMLGITDTLGLEWDEAACATAEAAGHARILGDLSMKSVADLIFEGEIASPPCQAWSTAGKGLGKLDKPRILAHVQRIREAGRWLNYSREGWHDVRSPLVLEPLRYALQGRPEWCAFEQVPAVLPLWEAFAEILREHEYGVATGVVSAERYGVPQTRKRAILLARRGQDVTLPEPTHQPYRKGKPATETHLPRWVSMAEALGWGFDAEPAATVTAGHCEPFASRPYRERGERSADEPAPTVAFGHDSASVRWIHEAPATTVQADPRIAPRGHHDRQFNGETVRVSVEEAARLQSFPPGYPWQGSKTKQYEQVGNAIPPVLAAALLGHLLGLPWHHVAHSMRPAVDPIIEEFPWLDAA